MEHSNFKECNPHPQGKLVGDCVKRAIVIASEINYHDISIMLNRYKKVTGSKKFNGNFNWRDFIIDVLDGYDVGNMQYANKGRRYTVSEYARQEPNRSIAQVSKHLVAIKYGCYYDTWDCGEKSIYKVWQIPGYDFLVYRLKTKFPKLCKGLTLERYKARISLL